DQVRPRRDRARRRLSRGMRVAYPQEGPWPFLRRRPMRWWWSCAVLLSIQSLSGCAWVDNAPIEMKLQGTTAQNTPCIAGNLGKEFQDTLPVVNRGNTHNSTEISVEAPRGGLLAFVTLDPLPSGDSHVTIYNGDLYWPRR